MPVFWEFTITCPQPGPYGDHNVEAEVHGYTIARTLEEEEAAPLSWKGQIEFTCEIGSRYTQGRATANPIALAPVDVTPLPEPGAAALWAGLLLVALLRRR